MDKHGALRSAALCRFEQAPPSLRGLFEPVRASPTVDADGPAGHPAEPRPTADHFAEVESAYDRAAKRHGLDFGTSQAGARARATAMRRIRALADPPARLLDVGCDTAFEAVHLARRGFRVVGLDVSAPMLDVARQRRDGADLDGEALSFRRLAARDVGRLADDGETFDLAYSVYGTLNLEPDLDPVARGLARLLPTGAPLLVGLLNPSPLFEMLAYPLAGNFKGYRKTLRPSVRLKIQRGAEEEVTCWLRSADRTAEAFGPHFELEEVRGLHILLPPPHGRLLEAPGLVGTVTRFEEAVGTRWPWNRLGYFSLLTLRRTAAGVPA